MKSLLLIGIIIMLAGPFRRWVGRHWALLVSVASGAILGFVFGSVLTCKFGAPAFTPLLAGFMGAVAAGQSGPAWLRQIEKDGRK
jgi:hypothetical protein